MCRGSAEYRIEPELPSMVELASLYAVPLYFATFTSPQPYS